MTAHRRVLLLRAGAAVALAAGVVLGAASPAYADDKIDVTIPADELEWRVGDPPSDLTATITNKQDEDVSVTLQFSIPGNLANDIAIQQRPSECGGNTCTIQFDAEESKTLTWKLTSSPNQTLQPNQRKSGDGRIRVTVPDGSAEANYKVEITGPNQAPSVPEVSGTITDSASGDAVRNAVVVLKDGAGKEHPPGGTDNSGRFRFTSTAANPIAPGQLTIGASKDGFEAGTITREARAGQALGNVQLKLRANATASAAPPSLGPEPTPEPTTAVETGPAQEDTTATRTAGDGTSPFSWVIIVLGGLLMLLGIGAIVLLVRRRDDSDDADPDDLPVRRGAAPAYRGAGADPTMMVNRAGAGPTMVGGMGGNANDATAIVRAPQFDDEYPDPYGAPRPTGQSGYGQPGYGQPASGGMYGGSGYGPSSGGPAGYGANPSPAPGYSGGTTPGYVPPPAPGGESYGGGGYPDQQRGGYPPAPARGGYNPDATERWTAGGTGGGYAGDQRGGYGPPGAPSSGGPGPGAPVNGYSTPSPGGYGDYEQRGGYAPAGGYDRDGYERVPEHRPPDGSGGGVPGGGYGGAGGYYGDGGPGVNGSNNGGRPNPPPRGGDRRSLDWMDD